MRVVVVPGIGGSDEIHWQSHWERHEPSWTRFAPTSWDAPGVDDWMSALDAAVADTVPVLVAHSLGCLTAVRWSYSNAHRVAGLFLVAPPNPEGPTFPRVAARFGEDVGRPIPVPALLVTSIDDEYCDPSRAQQFADQWKAAHVDVGAHGHLNSSSDVGDWSEGRNLLTAFSAGLR